MKYLCHAQQKHEQEEGLASSARNTNCTLWPTPHLIEVGFLVTDSNLIPQQCHRKLLLLELFLQSFCMVLQAINEAFSKYPGCVFGHSKYLFKCRTSVGLVSWALKFWSEIIPQIPHASSQARQRLRRTTEGKNNRSSRKLSGHCEMWPEIFIPCHNIPWNVLK